MGITQRMLPVTTTVLPPLTTIWGAAEDGTLNGGTRLLAVVDNQNANDAVTVTISVQATRGSAFVANANTVNVPASTAVSIAITGLSGYAMRFEGTTVLSADVETSVQVEQ